MKRTALVIIDAQVNMFDPQYPVRSSQQMLTHLQNLIRRARKSGIPLVYLRNNGDPDDVDAPGAPGWKIHPDLTPLLGEMVIDKFTPDGFEGTDLSALLQQLQIERLVLAGMQTDYCVAATCRSAVASGYEVTLVADAHSTYDTQEMSADEIIARHNKELKSLAEVLPSDKVKF